MARKKDSNERDVIPPAEFMLTLDGGLELWRTHLENVSEQQVNAQVMPPEMLERLAETIRRDSRMESLPFVAKHEDERGIRFEMISGHHRLRAARMASVQTIYVLADTHTLTRSNVVAKQLAHNAISGTPDPEIMSQMLAELDDIEDALEAFIDKQQLEDLIDKLPKLEEMPEDEGEWAMFSLIFLPVGMKRFERLLTRLTGDEALVGCAGADVFSDFQRAVVTTGKKYDIRNLGGALMKICDLATERMDEMEEPAQHE